MNFLSKMTSSYKQFKLFDISMFKLYVFAVGLLAVKLFPILISLDMRVYIVAAVIGAAIITPKMFIKNPKAKKVTGISSFYANAVLNFQQSSLLRITVFKTTMVLVAFLLIKIFPVIITLDLAWFIGLVFLAFGYIIATITKTK